MVDSPNLNWFIRRISSIKCISGQNTNKHTGWQTYCREETFETVNLRSSPKVLHTLCSMEFPGSLNRWDWWYIIPQLAVSKWYISGIYCQLGDYISPIPPIKGTRNHYVPSMSLVRPKALMELLCKAGLQKMGSACRSWCGFCVAFLLMKTHPNPVWSLGIKQRIFLRFLSCKGHPIYWCILRYPYRY